MVKQMKEKCSGGVPTTQGSARGRALAVLRVLLVHYHASPCVGFFLSYHNQVGRGREKKRNCGRLRRLVGYGPTVGPLID